jgi:hypothetical protein
MRALEEPIKMSFANETPLEDVLQSIKSTIKESGHLEIPIYLDPWGLSDAEKTATSVVTIDLDGVPLKTSLRLVLKQLDLAYCVKDGVLIISSVERVHDELKEAEAVGEVEGPALQAVTRAEPVNFGEPAPREGREPDIGELRSKALEKRLEVPIDVAFSEETPLEDVFRHIRDVARAPDGTGLPIYIDPAVLPSLKKLVQMNLPRVPLRTSLTLLLSQVGLSWGVHDGLLIISRKPRIEEIRRVAAAFSAGADEVTPQIEKFASPITLSFPEETPLHEAIKEIRKRTKGPDGAEFPVYYGPPVPILNREQRSLGPRGFELKKIDTLPIRIDVKDVPVRTCLALLLTQPKTSNGLRDGIDGRLIDGVLVIGEPGWLDSLQ